MTCKGICVRYKAQKPVGTGRYASGQRRCQICEIFIKWEGLWCPCCGYRLRTKPRNLKYKAKLRARVEADAIEADTKSIESMEKEIQAEAAAAKSKTKAKKLKLKQLKLKQLKLKQLKLKQLNQRKKHLVNIVKNHMCLLISMKRNVKKIQFY